MDGRLQAVIFIACQNNYSVEYVLHLTKDKRLGKLVSAGTPFQLRKRKNICTYLCASIMSQQLSTKVADVIYKRFLAIYEGKEPTPQQIVDTQFETLRAIGLSNAKVNYVQNVARFAIESGLDQKKLEKMSDEELVEYLTQIKGVGRWTVEMLLMFALGRKDIFAVDDLGIQNAMIKLYRLDRTDKKKFKEDLLRISAKWSPYRTFACMHLWQWKDEK
jgi:DNA-3-methyladenine glycosylase II